MMGSTEEYPEKLVRISTPGVWMPSEYTIGFQKSPDLIDELKAKNQYCSVCYTVTKDLGIFSRPDKPHPTESKLYLGWDVTLLDLIRSAEANCKFCCFMISRFFNDPMYTFFIGEGFSTKLGCCHQSASPSQATEVVQAIERTRENCTKYGNPCFKLIAQPDDYSVAEARYERLRFLVDSTNLTTAAAVEDILGYRRQIVIEVSAAEGSAISDSIKARPVNVDPGSTRSIEIARDWITDCLENHEQCKARPDSIQSQTATHLPTRVIKILNNDDLQLVSGDSPGKYTILSYCWGGPQQFVTTADTLTSRCAGFKTQQLPQTLRDAVNLTNSLGLEYLWIDAVCILQDSAGDKAIELPKMPSYYRNAHLTICASGKGCDSGFLAPKAQCEDHPGTGIPKDLLSMPYLAPNGEVDDIYFREENPYSLSGEPVSHRAWTYQERILSPRVLTYGGRLLWQCATIQKSAGGVQDWSFDSRSANDREIKLSLIEMKKELTETRNSGVAASPIPEDKHPLWYRAVEEFCERELTFAEDKFRAIAALANEFALALEDDYIAGLWKTDLLRGLMWSTWPALDVQKPEAWRAPSWSWASVESSVTYSRLPTLPTTELSKVLSIQIIPKSATFPYGEISSAVIEVQGPIFDFNLDKMTEKLQQQYQTPAPQDSMEWRKMMMNPSKGQLGSNKDWKLLPGSVFLVLLAEPVVGDEENVSAGVDADDISEQVGLLHGLVLTPAENGTYQRASSFAGMRVKGYLNLRSREQTIRII